MNGFFAISGFLVTMSFDRRGWRDYVIARTLRIAPGLIVATLVVALLLGSAMTVPAARAYLRERGLWRFIVATLTTFKSNIALPGVFDAESVPLPDGDGVDAEIRDALLRRPSSRLGIVGFLRSALDRRRSRRAGSP